MKTTNVLMLVAFTLSTAACSGDRVDATSDRTGTKSISPAAPVVTPELEAPKPLIQRDEPAKPKDAAANANATSVHRAVVQPKGPLAIKRLVVSRSIENREPIDDSETFSIQDGTRVYAFVEVDNPSREENEISVSFEAPDGRSRGSVPLHVGPGSRWRTWAQTRFADQAGRWTVSVRDSTGKLLCQTMFEIAGS